MDSLITQLSHSFNEARYKNPDSALRIANNSLKNHGKVPLVQAWKNFLRGNYYYDKQNADSAIFYFDKVFKHIKAQDDPGLYNETKILTAMVYKNMQQFPKALEYLKEAETEINNNSNKKTNSLKINLYRAFGAYYLDVYQYENSISYLIKALKLIEKEKGQEKNLANVNLNLAEAYIALEDFNRAKKYLIDAKGICEQIGYQMGKFTSDMKLAEIAVNTDNIQDYPIANLESAIEYFESIHIVPLIIQSRFYLARIHELSGKIDEAKVEFLKTLELSKQIGLNQGIINISRNLGQLEEREKRYESALVYYSEALELAKTGVMLDTQELLTNNIATIYEKMGNYTEAFKFLQEAQNLNDSINKTEGLKITRELETKYQSEKKEEEIKLLTAQNELAEEQRTNQRNSLLAILGLITLIGIFLFFLYRNRQKTTTKLKELNEAKSTFFANISHEFRTPLTLIKGPLEDQLQLLNIPASNRKNLLAAQRNAQRLENLVEELLALSKLESGNLKLQVQQGNITGFLAVEAEAFLFLCQEKHIKYTTAIEDNPNLVWFDRDVLEKIIVNLLGNAVKYTPENGTIIFKAETNNGICLIKVTNSGSYITSAQSEHIFERFYQTNPQNPGTGIGLALTKELTELHHGTIKVTSEQKDGTTFKVSLPVNKDAYKNVEILSESFNETEFPSRLISEEVQVPIVSLPEDAPILLIVDDSDEVRHYVASIFEGAYKIQTAKNGQEGFQNAIENIPDLVVSDVMMPVEDGFALTKNLKENELTSHIPIILLTAKTEATDKLQGMGVGADAYISKPFSSQILKATVANLIENRRKMQQRFAQEVILRPKDIAISGADERFLERLQTVLDKNITFSDFSIESFSQEMGVSRMQLHRKLKALTGQATTEFLRSQRLKMAVKLLKENKINISEVGYAVGFNDPSYFTRCFKQEYGVSPSHFI